MTSHFRSFLSVGGLPAGDQHACGEVAWSRVTFGSMGASDDDRMEKISRLFREIADARMREVSDSLSKLGEAATRSARDAAKRLGEAQTARLSQDMRNALWLVALVSALVLLKRVDPRRWMRHPSERN